MKRNGFLFREMSVTTKLILINAAIFFLVSILAFFIPNIFDYLALKPADILQGKNLWTIFTSIFIHANVMHILFNMFSLWFVGGFVEKIIGRKRFIWFYLISGVFASIVFVLAAGAGGMLGGIWEKILGDPTVAGVGASGALFGIIGLLTILTPRNRVYLIAGPLVAIIIEAVIESFVSNSAVLSVISVVVSVYIFISIFSLFSLNPRTRRISFPLEMPFWVLPIVAIVPLVIIGLFVPLPIGNTAHFGGLIAGLIYGLYLRKKYKRKVQMLDRMFK